MALASLCPVIPLEQNKNQSMSKLDLPIGLGLRVCIG